MDTLVQPEELYQQLQRDNPPFVVDVRGVDAYTAGHIPGAMHIPGEQIASRMAEIPKDKPTVLY
jgi:rhodanese-related sulfurtransferase